MPGHHHHSLPGNISTHSPQLCSCWSWLIGCVSWLCIWWAGSSACFLHWAWVSWGERNTMPQEANPNWTQVPSLCLQNYCRYNLYRGVWGNFHHTAHTQIHHSSAVVGTESHIGHGKQKREVHAESEQISEPKCHVQKDRKCYKKPVQTSHQIPRQMCVQAPRQVHPCLRQVCWGCTTRSLMLGNSTACKNACTCDGPPLSKTCLSKTYT